MKNNFKYILLIIVGVGLGVFGALHLSKSTTPDMSPIQTRVVEGSFAKYFEKDDEQMILVGRDSCPACQRLKQKLDNSGTRYTYYPLSEENKGRSIMNDLYANVIPVSVFRGKAVIGFDAEAIDLELSSITKD